MGMKLGTRERVLRLDACSCLSFVCPNTIAAMILTTSAVLLANDLISAALEFHLTRAAELLLWDCCFSFSLST